MSIVNRLDKLEKAIEEDYKTFCAAVRRDFQRIIAQANPERKGVFKRLRAIKDDPRKDPETLNKFIDILEAEIDPAIQNKWPGYFKSAMSEFREKGKGGAINDRS